MMEHDLVVDDAKGGGGDIFIVSSAYGSQGDIGPLLALARTLHRRVVQADFTTTADGDGDSTGYTIDKQSDGDDDGDDPEVVFVGNGYFREEVEASGLRFAQVGTREGYEDLLANSQRRKDKRALVRYWLSHLEEHYETLDRLVRGRRRAVVVAHPLVRYFPAPSPPPHQR